MAKIKIVGNAVAIIADLTMESIKTLEKYDPKALRVYSADESGKPVEVFRVRTAETGDGELNSRGAVFTKTVHDGSGRASITAILPDGVENAEDYAAEKYGFGLSSLIAVESQVGPALAQVAEKQAAVKANIEVC